MITFFFLYLPFLLSPQIIKAAATPYPPYTPTEHILLNCGSSSKLSSPDGQSWDADIGSKSSSDDNNSENISFPATAAQQDPSISSPVPFMTARIIRSHFSYTFPVSPGQKILRLYFYPATYSGNLYPNQSFFAVTANQYTLLKNFSAFLAVSEQKPRSASLVKEFIINVEGIQVLNVTFSASANSYAFVNGIEVVSIPDNLYMGSHDNNNDPLKLVNFPKVIYSFDQSNTAFETLYRLNVGGNAVAGVDDTGLFRDWYQDDNFIFGDYQGNPLSNETISLKYTSQTPYYSAPTNVYTTARAMGLLSLKYNLTWIFEVDSGFYYLVRLHFCEFMPYLINGTNQRVFTIFINNKTAELEADIIQWTGGTGSPIFRDFVVLVRNSSYNREGKQDLFLALSPYLDSGSIYADGILNGLEIFKLNRTDGNLAGSNPELVVETDELVPNLNPEEEEKKGSGRIGMIFALVGAVAVGGVMIFVLVSLRRRRETKNLDGNNGFRSAVNGVSVIVRSRFLQTSSKCYAVLDA